jgi:hypothetical protein
VDALNAVADRLEYPGFDAALQRVRGRRDGRFVSFGYAARPPPDDPEARLTWTEVTVEIAPARLLLELRPDSARERRWLRTGVALDLRLGDAAFDAAFVVEGAPVEVVHALLDERWRRRLLAVAPLVARCDGPEVCVARPGWFIAPEEALALLDLALELAAAVPAAVRRVEGAAPRSGNPYRDAPAADGDAPRRAARLRELAALVALRERRKRD